MKSGLVTTVFIILLALTGEMNAQQAVFYKKEFDGVFTVVLLERIDSVNIDMTVYYSGDSGLVLKPKPVALRNVCWKSWRDRTEKEAYFRNMTYGEYSSGYCSETMELKNGTVVEVDDYSTEDVGDGEHGITISLESEKFSVLSITLFDNDGESVSPINGIYFRIEGGIAVPTH